VASPFRSSNFVLSSALSVSFRFVGLHVIINFSVLCFVAFYKHVSPLCRLLKLYHINSFLYVHLTRRILSFRFVIHLIMSVPTNI
jgi:hypothetical protein